MMLPREAIIGLIVAGALAWAWHLFRRWRHARGWRIGPFVHGRNYSEGLPLRPAKTATGWRFDLAPGGQVDAVDRDTGPLSGKVRVRFRLIDAEGATLTPFEDSYNEATVGIYFQRAGDTWAGTGRWEVYRWYSRQVLLLNAGSGTLEVAFTPEEWVSVGFKPGNEHPLMFAAARREAARIGLTFGSASLRSHGVVTDKPVTFELLEWSVG